MKTLMREERFDGIKPSDKDFIIAFDREMQELGYDFGGEIGSGYCWGKYMIIYAKTGVKAKKVAARIFIREEEIVLRLFFSKIDSHRAYIEKAPPHIKEAFTGSQGDCHHCEHKPEGVCNFRKSYTIDGKAIEKCSDVVFEYHEPSVEKLPDYMGLLREFYGARRRTA
ncbi:MAG: hypothetical protein ACK5LX_09405 [Oscillospiraceae bacterium]